MHLRARSPVAQPITLRVVDSTGQTHQFKTRIKGTGRWEAVAMPLNRGLEHWDGANDGVKPFPLIQFYICIPLPNEDAKTGKIEFTGAAIRSSN